MRWAFTAQKPGHKCVWEKKAQNQEYESILWTYLSSKYAWPNASSFLLPSDHSSNDASEYVVQRTVAVFHLLSLLYIYTFPYFTLHCNKHFTNWVNCLMISLVHTPFWLEMDNFYGNKSCQCKKFKHLYKFNHRSDDKTICTHTHVHVRWDI